jgi:hypothetical protein
MDKYTCSVNPLIALNVRNIYNDRALETFPDKSDAERELIINAVFEHVEENNYRAEGILKLWGEWVYE